MKNPKPTPREKRLLSIAKKRWHGVQLSQGLPAKHHLKPRNFPDDQLAVGIGVELEHTGKPELAMEIAMAHLYERPDYYARLKQMEASPVRRDTSRQQRKWISEKIRLLRREGYPERQAVAIALRMAGVAKKRS